MNDQTTGTPKRRPATTDPKPLMTVLDGEDIDAASRAALNAIQRRFEETWDAKAGLQEVLLTEHYHRAVAAQESEFDVKVGLAAIVGPPPAWVHWVDQLSDPADGGADLIAMDDEAREVYLVTVKHHHLPTPPDTLKQIGSVAGRILAVLKVTREADRVELIRDGGYTGAMSIALDSATRLQRLPGAIEDRLVTREQAVQVVESAGSACADLWRRVHMRTLAGRTAPQDLMYCEEVLLDLSKEAFELRAPVQRLFDPSDDLIDTLR